MKKNITLLFCFLANLGVQAQTDFPLQFVDKDGQVIADGTELILTDYEVDEFFGDIQMPVNVWVKNISSEMVQGGATYTIQTISNGWFQTCFPVNCMRLSATGTYLTESDSFISGQSVGMQTEWFPADEGVCVVTYQLQTYRQNPRTHKWMLDEDGPSITLNYCYGTTGIEGTKSVKTVRSLTYLDLKGQIIDSPRNGIYIKKTMYTDGTFDIQKSLFP